MNVDPSLTASQNSKISLEERKFVEESAIRQRELDLKELEISAKKSELKRSRFLDPTVLGLFAAAAGLFGNLVVALLNNRNTQEVERSREQSALIVQAVSTGNLQTACTNLIAFINLGLLDDPHGRISRCDPASIPVLPANTRTYAPVEDTPWAAQMAAVVTRMELKDSYRYSVTFTVPKPPIDPYLFNLVTIYASRRNKEGEQKDEVTLPALTGNWRSGDRVTISADLPKSYVDDPGYYAFLRFCVGSVAMCMPGGNLLLPRS